MKKQITKVSGHQTSKVLALFNFVAGIPIWAFILISFLIAPKPVGPDGQPVSPALGLLFILITPFLYGIMGYIFTRLACFVYNMIKKKFGGIEFEVSEIDDS